jgi:nucleoside-diphosphate-sugar epimerase
MILVTGASGFVGRALLCHLAAQGNAVRAAYRNDAVSPPAGVQSVSVGDLGSKQDWGAALQAVNVVVHAAARVHIMKDVAIDPLSVYRKVNVDGTLNLATQAAAAGVRRFIFLSSVKVHGESTAEGGAFRADKEPIPVDSYGISKLEAERGLQVIAAQTGMEVVIIRPPLVYGPGVRGNFAALMQAVVRGIPFPLGAINNRRSLVALDNLVDLIVTCLDHPKAGNQTFLVCDGEDLSTPDLMLRMAGAMNKTAYLIPLPISLMSVIARIFGKSAALQRLCGNLQVDITETVDVLGWKPPIDVDEGLRRAVVQWRK